MTSKRAKQNMFYGALIVLGTLVIVVPLSVIWAQTADDAYLEGIALVPIALLAFGISRFYFFGLRPVWLHLFHVKGTKLHALNSGFGVTPTIDDERADQR